MSDRRLVERVKDAGQALIAIAIIAGFLGGVAVKALAWVSAGPTALNKAERLEKDVRRLKRQSRFTVKVLEKLGKEKYDWRTEDREVELVEPE